MNHEELPGWTRFSDETPEDAHLEAALRAALERKNPPLGFAQRVEKKLAQKKRTPIHARNGGWMRLERQFAIAAALLLTVILPLGWRLHRQADLARGEAAKQQVMLALRITGMQLKTIEERTQAMNGRMTEGETR